MVDDVENGAVHRSPVVVRVWQAGWQGAVRRRSMLGANSLGPTF